MCDWWYNVDCQSSPYKYGVNHDLYQEPVAASYRVPGEGYQPLPVHDNHVAQIQPLANYEPGGGHGHNYPSPQSSYYGSPSNVVFLKKGVPGVQYASEEPYGHQDGDILHVTDTKNVRIVAKTKNKWNKVAEKKVDATTAATMSAVSPAYATSSASSAGTKKASRSDSKVVSAKAAVKGTKSANSATTHKPRQLIKVVKRVIKSKPSSAISAANDQVYGKRSAASSSSLSSSSSASSARSPSGQFVKKQPNKSN